jgi:hypothetical protein
MNPYSSIRILSHDDNRRFLGPISYTTQPITPSPRHVNSSPRKLDEYGRNNIKYIFTCMVPYNISFTYKIKTIIRNYLTNHMHLNKYKNTLFHVSATANIIFIYSENVEYILDMLNAVKNILNCSRCIGNTLPQKYKNRIDSHNAQR